MKQKYTKVAVVVIGLVLVWQFASHSVAQTSTNADASLQDVDLRQQYVARGAQYDEMLKAQEDGMKRQEEMEKRMERIVTRNEQEQDRFEKILDTWERQQKQYQTYLDSLGKK